MKPLSTLGFLHLTTLAKPVCDRSIYKLIRKHNMRSFVEVGLGDGTRCQNILRVAQKFSTDSLRYTGVDMFDARESGQEPLKLIEMHRVLNEFPAKTQLVPGELQSAINRIANSHQRTDMVVISAGYEAEALDAAMFYIPRMLHSQSLVLLQNDSGKAFKVLQRFDIEQWVTNVEKTTTRKAA